MQLRKFIPKKKQLGVSLLETALVTVIASGFFVMYVKEQALLTQKERARSVYDSMESFRRASVQFLSGNFYQINRVINGATDPLVKQDTKGWYRFCKAAGDNANDDTKCTPYCVHRNATDKICEVNVELLKHNSAVSAEYNDLNPYKQKWFAVYHVANQAGDMEVGVFAQNQPGSLKVGMDELALVAELSGGAGGYVPPESVGSCGANQACGTRGGWKLNINTNGTFKPGS